MVKNQKSTEGSVIYVLGNLQRNVSDWLPLINKLDTIATYSIPTVTCQQQLTTPNNAWPCVRTCRPEVLPNRTKKGCYYTGSNSTIERERERERERVSETEREKERGRRREGERWMSRIKGQTHKSKFGKPTLTELHSTPHYAPVLNHG